MALTQTPFYETNSRDFKLFYGNTIKILQKFPSAYFDMIFADPPYFLSNGGFSVYAGQKVSVNKGDWDKSHGQKEDFEFTHKWLSLCQHCLKDNGTIWVCGTFHNIFTVASTLTLLGYRILNAVTWQKTNPPPNLSCRLFTHSTEILVWARKSKSIPHYYNYELMRKLAGNRQMTDVWRLPAIAPWEKTCGKHPTQKPLSLLCRAILASTIAGNRILDPFTGSSTTGIAANMLGRDFVGIDNEKSFLEISQNRRELLPQKFPKWVKNIPDLQIAPSEISHPL